MSTKQRSSALRRSYSGNWISPRTSPGTRKNRRIRFDSNVETDINTTEPMRSPKYSITTVEESNANTRRKVRLIARENERKSGAYGTQLRADGTRNSRRRDRLESEAADDDHEIKQIEKAEQQAEAEAEIRPAEHAFKKTRKNVYGRIISKMRKLVGTKRNGKKRGGFRTKYRKRTK